MNLKTLEEIVSKHRAKIAVGLTTAVGLGTLALFHYFIPLHQTPVEDAALNAISDNKCQIAEELPAFGGRFGANAQVQTFSASSSDWNPLVDSYVKEVDEKRIKDNICFLQSEGNGCSENGTRATGTEGSRKAQKYIYEILKSSGWNVKKQDFSFKGTVWRTEPIKVKPHIKSFSRFADVHGTNIIAVKQGISDKAVVFCAHYDSKSHFGKGDVPGADDNGSGTAALLEMGRVLGNGMFYNTIYLVAVDAEESGLHGTKAILDRLDSGYKSKNIFKQHPEVEVICADMIGYDLKKNSELAVNVGEGGKSDGLASKVARIISAYNRQNNVIFITRNHQSDAREFSEAGYPVVSFGEPNPSKNPNMHKSSDTAKNINFDYLKSNIQLVTATVSALANPLWDVDSLFAFREQFSDRTF